MVVEDEAGGPETAGAETGAVALTTCYVGVPEDVLVAGVAGERRNGLVCSIGAFRERHDYELESGGRITVPGAVEGDVEVAECAVEFTVDGS